jgi:uncharacterized damage-inducible protein DinB
MVAFCGLKCNEYPAYITKQAELDATRNLTLRALRAMPEDDLYRIRRLAEYETIPEWVLHHLMQHEAKHRGQIGDLRLQAGQAHP